jgi:anti-sigma factor RsiW
LLIMDAHFQPDNSAMDPLDTNTSYGERDRFELLSAYLDGEVTSAERQQVEAWLASDLKTQQLHRRLLMVRQGFQNLPTPPTTQSVDQTIDAVFQRVDRRSRLRVIAGGVAAVAAGIVAVVAGLTVGSNSPPPQMATAPRSGLERSTDSGASPANPASEDLLIALDQPVLIISKTAVAADTQQPSPVRAQTADWQKSTQ